MEEIASKEVVKSALPVIVLLCVRARTSRERVPLARKLTGRARRHNALEVTFSPLTLVRTVVPLLSQLMVWARAAPRVESRVTVGGRGPLRVQSVPTLAEYVPALRTQARARRLARGPRSRSSTARRSS